MIKDIIFNSSWENDNIRKTKCKWAKMGKAILKCIFRESYNLICEWKITSAKYLNDRLGKYESGSGSTAGSNYTENCDAIKR